MTIVGLRDFVKESIFSVTQVLFADHVHWRFEVYDKFFFLRFKNWCRQALFSEDEKNVAFSYSFNFNIFLASFHAASRTPCSCHFVSSWDLSSNFGALGLLCWGSPGQIFASERFPSRLKTWRATTFVNFTRRIGFRVSELLKRWKFRRIQYDQFSCVFWKNVFNGFLRSIILFILQQCYCTLVTFLFGFLAGLSNRHPFSDL